MYDLREIKTEDADQIFEQAIRSMDEKDYSKVVKLSRATKVKAEEIENLHKEASKLINLARNAMDTIKHLGLRVENAEELYNKATVSFSEHKYQETLDLANQLIDLINSEKDKFQEAQESVSFAKLVISNAESFGANVNDAAELVREAETALTEKRYDRAIEVATKAKDIAEQAKRQQQRISKRR
jgi:tetratricopeptide (TPR) repeat protein